MCRITRKQARRDTPDEINTHAVLGAFVVLRVRCGGVPMKLHDALLSILVIEVGGIALILFCAYTGS
jgi:hypothetical protein